MPVRLHALPRSGHEMSSLAQLISARDAAATDYATKVAALRTSFVELAALDIVLGSPGVGYQQQRPGFGDYPDALIFRHAFAAPTFGGSFAADVKARVAAIMAAYPSPDA